MDRQGTSAGAGGRAAWLGTDEHRQCRGTVAGAVQGRANPSWSTWSSPRSSPSCSASGSWALPWSGAARASRG